MFPLIDTRIPKQVEAEILSKYQRLFPKGDRAFVSRAFAWATECFTGHFSDYQAIDARYHDFEHTLQGTLCLVRLLAGRQAAGATPVIDRPLFELTLVAILFHDTGYLKKRDDREGTGAKYTVTHVERSASFAREFLSTKGYGAADLKAMQNMIRCTGINANLARIPFRSEAERLAGYALATADLLGQMAAPDYVEKLPILFSEFVEAAGHGGEKAARFAIYPSADDLMRHTPAFWENYVQPRINRDFRGLYKFLSDPYPDGLNQYLDQIQKNLARLRNAAPA